MPFLFGRYFILKAVYYTNKEFRRSDDEIS